MAKGNGLQLNGDEGWERDRLAIGFICLLLLELLGSRGHFAGLYTLVKIGRGKWCTLKSIMQNLLVLIMNLQQI